MDSRVVPLSQSLTLVIFPVKSYRGIEKNKHRFKSLSCSQPVYISLKVLYLSIFNFVSFLSGKCYYSKGTLIRNQNKWHRPSNKGPTTGSWKGIGPNIQEIIGLEALRSVFSMILIFNDIRAAIAMAVVTREEIIEILWTHKI